MAGQFEWINRAKQKNIRMRKISSNREALFLPSKFSHWHKLVYSVWFNNPSLKPRKRASRKPSSMLKVKKPPGWGIVGADIFDVLIIYLYNELNCAPVGPPRLTTNTTTKTTSKNSAAMIKLIKRPKFLFFIVTSSTTQASHSFVPHSLWGHDPFFIFCLFVLCKTDPKCRSDTT